MDKKTLKPVKVVVTRSTAYNELTALSAFAGALARDLARGDGVSLVNAQLLHDMLDDIRANTVRIEEVQPEGPEPRPLVPIPSSIELHLGPDPDFTKCHSRQVKAMGGTYTECRGYNDTRFVTLPNDDRGRALANELMRRYPGHDWGARGSKRNRTCVVFRGGSDIGNVKYIRNNSPDCIEAALGRYASAVNAAIDEGRTP